MSLLGLGLRLLPLLALAPGLHSTDVLQDYVQMLLSLRVRVRIIIHRL